MFRRDAAAPSSEEPQGSGRSRSPWGFGLSGPEQEEVQNADYVSKS